MREQANKYVACMGAHVFLHRFARLKVGIYQLSDTAKKVLIPPRKRKDKVAFTNMYGRVQIFTIWFRLPYRYDSRGLRKLVISNSFEGFSNE